MFIGYFSKNVFKLIINKIKGINKENYLLKIMNELPKKTKSVGLKSCSRMKPKQENVINHENNKNNVGKYQHVISRR